MRIRIVYGVEKLEQCSWLDPTVMIIIPLPPSQHNTSSWWPAVVWKCAWKVPLENVAFQHKKLIQDYAAHHSFSMNQWWTKSDTISIRSRKMSPLWLNILSLCSHRNSFFHITLWVNVKGISIYWMQHNMSNYIKKFIHCLLKHSPNTCS